MPSMKKEDNSLIKNNSYTIINKKPIHKAWIILIGCCFLQAGALGNILTSAGVFMVPVCQELGFARAELSLYLTAYFLCGIVGMPIAGRLLSKYNIRIVMSISVTATALASGLMGTYTELWQWIVSGVVFGSFGSCVFMIPYSAMIANWFEKRAGFAIGVASCCAALSAAIFAPMYQAIISGFGWRIAYFVQGVIVAAFILPWVLLVFRLRPSDIGAKPYGSESKLSAEGKTEERKSQLPGVPVKKAIFSVSFFMLFIFAGITALVGSGFDSHLPGYVISIGFDATFGAITVSALQVGSFIEKMVMGVLNDKIGVQKTVFIELVIIILGITGLLLFKSPWLLLISAFLFGVQDSLMAVSFPLLLRQIFGNKDYTQIYSYARVGSGVFGSFAAVMVGFSYDSTGSFVPAFIGAVALCILGALVIIAAYRCRKQLTWEQ